MIYFLMNNSIDSVLFDKVSSIATTAPNPSLCIINGTRINITSDNIVKVAKLVKQHNDEGKEVWFPCSNNKELLDAWYADMTIDEVLVKILLS